MELSLTVSTELISSLCWVTPDDFNLLLTKKVRLKKFLVSQNQNFRAPRCCQGTSPVVQWLRIRLPTQGTQVRALVREDPTCRGATKPVRHNYWSCALEPMSHNYWAHVPQLLKPARLEPVLRNKRSHRSEKPAHRNEQQPPLAATRESLHAATKTQCSQK